MNSCNMNRIVRIAEVLEDYKNIKSTTTQLGKQEVAGIKFKI